MDNVGRGAARLGFALALSASIVALANLAPAGPAAAGEPSGDPDAACRVPFEKLKDPKTGDYFALSSAINENEKLTDHVRRRYIVGDFNSTDEAGNCRGVQEFITPMDQLSDFSHLRPIADALKTDLAGLTGKSLASLLASEFVAPDDIEAVKVEYEDLRNFLEQVQRYRTEPVEKPAVVNGYCVGQTLSFCEVVNGQPKLIYRFVTSSSRTPPPLNRYYAPINFINTRHWSSDRQYTPADGRRDMRMGGGDAIPIPFANGGNPIEMPNFMNFLPMAGYTGQTLNGIHEIAGGLDSGGTFGAPVSLGCVRLNKFEAKLARWWTPRLAKFFVYFEPDRYRTYGDATTGRARAAQAPAYASSNTDDFSLRSVAPPQLPSLPFFPWFASQR